VFQPFAKTDAGIEHQTPPLHARLLERMHAVSEKRAHFCYHISVDRIDLHALRVTAHVHDARPQIAVCKNSHHLGIAKAGDIIEEMGARLHGRASNGRAPRVHRETHIEVGQGFKNRNDAPQLFLRIHRFCARTR